MKSTDDNLDVLQNLEFAVCEVWRRHPEMTDHVARRAYEAAFELYRAEQRGRTVRPHTLTDLDREAFDALKAVCEWRLGRGEAPVPGAEKIPALPIDALVECFGELRKSVERHTKLGGRQGYLTFIGRFLP